MSITLLSLINKSNQTPLNYAIQKLLNHYLNKTSFHHKIKSTQSKSSSFFSIPLTTLSSRNPINKNRHSPFPLRKQGILGKTVKFNNRPNAREKTAFFLHLLSFLLIFFSFLALLQLQKGCWNLWVAK